MRLGSTARLLSARKGVSVIGYEWDVENKRK